VAGAELRAWLVLRAAGDLVFPPRCAACGEGAPVNAEGGAPLCEDCERGADRVGESRCTVCGVPFPGGGPAHPCPRCAEKTPPYARAQAAFLHGGTVAEAIRRMKYGDRPHLARRLGRWLAVELQNGRVTPEPCDAVVPLPLHPRRVAERGFDQAYLLAREVARALGVRFLPSAARRTRPTAQQTRLDREAREENVKGAFAASETVRGLRLLLVDDVLTTGATASACARALLAASALRVEVLTLARAE
jgi:ComF family protein